jgi:hypothetical protein
MTLVKDLLRRRVPQVVAIYLGACWGIVEFVDFITQRFALSPHLIDLALVGPLLLLPSVILRMIGCPRRRSGFRRTSW